jgi:hypothetical protein
MLMTALNACITVGYVAGAAVKDNTPPASWICATFSASIPTYAQGYETLRYTVKLKGNGTPQQFREIHETVIKTSPNYFNVSQPIRIDAKPEVE